MTAAAAQTRWVDAVVSGLVDAGVREVLACPGSRSTPLVLAVARRAELRLAWVIDERSAAFACLGQARLTGRPSVLLVTSGTAGAHAFPAVVEAGEARVPMVVITADRPPALQGCGASQTVDQTRLFGAHARRFADLGPPRDDDGARAGARRQVLQAVRASLGPDPGAVQLDVPLDKPLEPEHAPAQGIDAAPAAPRPRLPTVRDCTFAAVAAVDPAGLRAAAAVVAGARRPLIVAGPAGLAQVGAAEAVARLARALGAPVYAEGASQLRYGDVTAGADGLGWLLASASADAVRPDVVVQLGAAPVLGAWEPLLARARPRRVVLAAHGWPDPTSDAEVLVSGDVAAAAGGLADALVAPTAEAAQWTAALTRASAAAWAAVEDVVAAAPLSEAAAARLVRAQATRGVLAVGNSLPIRHLDAWVRAGGPGLRVVSQRGAAGIDGLISGAAGIAALGEPVVLLLGDVSFLHDVGGLATAARLARAPLAIVVVDNGGGRIFEELPLARHPEGAAAIEAFTTPHGLDLAAVAAGFGVTASRVDTAQALAQGLAAALERGAVSVLVAVTPADRTRALAAEVTARAAPAIARALAEVPR